VVPSLGDWGIGPLSSPRLPGPAMRDADPVVRCNVAVFHVLVAVTRMGPLRRVVTAYPVRQVGAGVSPPAQACHGPLLECSAFPGQRPDRRVRAPFRAEAGRASAIPPRPAPPRRHLTDFEHP